MRAKNYFIKEEMMEKCIVNPSYNREISLGVLKNQRKSVCEKRRRKRMALVVKYVKSGYEHERKKKV